MTGRCRVLFRINNSTVHASFRKGTARLRGTVASLGAKGAAISAAGNVLGVRDVDAALEVRRTGISDTSLRRALDQLLKLSAVTSDAELETSVGDGVVPLRGEVDGYALRADERGIAARIGLAP